MEESLQANISPVTYRTAGPSLLDHFPATFGPVVMLCNHKCGGVNGVSGGE